MVKAPGSIRRRARVTRDVWVTPSRPTDAITSSASNRSCTESGVPVHSALVMTDNPPMCEIGRQHNQRSDAGSTPRRPEVISADASIASWVNTTPLGRPVVPLVAITTASPGSTGRPPDNDRRSPSCSITWVGARASRRSRRSVSGNLSSMGAIAAPRAHSRSSASTNRSPGEIDSAVRSGKAADVQGQAVDSVADLVLQHSFEDVGPEATSVGQPHRHRGGVTGLGVSSEHPGRVLAAVDLRDVRRSHPTR